MDTDVLMTIGGILFGFLVISIIWEKEYGDEED